ncbi:MAG: hypothetical protein OEZ36_04710 [Spirochaetota bacterium]|nr:hypothetical protein [Spirochaetota bacterium]
MKRSAHIVKQEWLFLKALVEDRILEIDSVNAAVDKAIDKLCHEREISRPELVSIILINFKYGIQQAIKESDLEFDFKELSVTEICYFYFMHRLKNSIKYLC